MIEACRSWLETYLKSLGIKQVAAAADDGARINAHPAARIIMGETTTRYDGSLVARLENFETGEKRLRRRIYEARLEVSVKLTHRDQLKAEALREDFLTGLPVRIDDGSGNAILIAAQGGEPEEDASVLKQLGATYVDMVFEGGIYRDFPIKVVIWETDMEVENEITQEV